MTLTGDDLQAIRKVIDERLDAKLEEKLESKLEEKLESKLEEKLESKFAEKLAPIYEFIEFAKPALEALLDESQANFEQKLPQRVKQLENIHPAGHHAS